MDSDSMEGRPKLARIRYSFPPGNDLIDQTTDDFSGTYLHAPMVVLNFGESASLGTGTTISTLFAVDLRLNCDFALTMISTLECECVSISDSIQIKGLTCVLRR